MTGSAAAALGTIGDEPSARALLRLLDDGGGAPIVRAVHSPPDLVASYGRRFSSTRRFVARPSGVPLSAIGWDSP